MVFNEDVELEAFIEGSILLSCLAPVLPIIPLVIVHRCDYRRDVGAALDPETLEMSEHALGVFEFAIGTLIHRERSVMILQINVDVCPIKGNAVPTVFFDSVDDFLTGVPAVAACVKVA